MDAVAGHAIGPRNPFLADSGYAMAHGRCDQQDNSPVRGPTGPSAVLGPDDMAYVWTGPGHFGGCISSPYADGRRVIWTNGRQEILKLDYDTLDPLGRLPLGRETVTPIEELAVAADLLDLAEGDDAIGHAATLGLRFMTGLDGVYSVLDRDGTLFVGCRDGVVAYGDAVPGDRSSPVVVRGRWAKPPDVPGLIVGLNMTFDGRLVVTTDHGMVAAVERSLDHHVSVALRGSEDAAEWCAAQHAARGNTAYGWVRTSCCVDEHGGIYVVSRDHVHKVVWTGDRLSLDDADGAWTAPYRNGTGHGSGTTPSLMGFGDEDRFVVFGDGDPVVNVTLMWRDGIPDGWRPPAGAPSPRIAGIGRAHMGDPSRGAIQTEQSITVSGYGAMTVNNEPPTVPAGFPPHAARGLVFFLGHRAPFTPHGMHKFEWDPGSRALREAWVNTEVSSPNSVPFVSQAAGLVYTCGTRDGRWTIEAVDWTTGASRFHFVLGGSRCNTLGAGITLDEEGRLLFGTIFGKIRVHR